MAKSRIGVLDSLRGVAALCVVAYHYTHIYRARYGHSFSGSFDFEAGLYGVPLFFVISGFVIFMTAEKCSTQFEFLYRRFVRLYPTYWLCILFSLTIPNVIYDRQQFTGSQVMVNLTMLQKVFNVKSIDGVYWSLFPELLFYGIIFLLISVKKLRSVFIWGGVWIALSVINAVFGLNYLDFLFRYAGLFMAGILFYRIYKGDNGLSNHIGILLCYLTVILNEWRQPRGEAFVVISILIIFLIFYAFIYNRLKFLDYSILRFFGYISYPLYLIHQEFGYSIMLALNSRGLTGPVWIVLPVVLSIMVAYLITRFLEKPILSFAKKVEVRLFPAVR